MAKIINGVSLPNIPWQDRPDNCNDAVWRYSKNPIIGRNPAKGCARVFNSAVVPYGDGFIGVFRSDHTDGVPGLHVGRSSDGVNWEIDSEPISWVDENGTPFNSFYSYDPRLLWLEDAYYIVWCTDAHGPDLDAQRILSTLNVCLTLRCHLIETVFYSPEKSMGSIIC